jgi:zinc protease
VIGLGLEFDRQFVEAIEAVTEADIQNVAQKYFTNPAISVVGSADALKQVQ